MTFEKIRVFSAKKNLRNRNILSIESHNADGFILNNRLKISGIHINIFCEIMKVMDL